MRNFWFQFKSRCFNPFWNLLTFILNLFIRRDIHIALFGSRNRDRFSGNSRFVFQYLAENKEQYGFSHVVWVTENPSVVNELTSMGYECYMIHSIKSIYFHLKAGWHVCCGNRSPANTATKEVKTDIIVKFSKGAKCIFMFHVISFPKRWQRDDMTLYKSSFEKFMLKCFYAFLKNRFIRDNILYTGDWGNPIYVGYDKKLAAFEENKDIKLILTSYPALHSVVRFMPEEQDLIKNFFGRKVILYTPTFRAVKKTDYKSPLENEVFVRFLRDNRLLWVEKLHALADDSMKASRYEPDISLLLDDKFDINVICQKVDVMVTDYSSTYQKAVFYHIPFAFWGNDLDNYNAYDSGVNHEFMEFAGNLLCKDINSLIKTLSEMIKPDWVDAHKDLYEKGRKLYFNTPDDSLETICNKLFKD